MGRRRNQGCLGGIAAPACTSAGRSLALPRPADRETPVGGCDMGGRGRVAPHWLRGAVPLHWARYPGLAMCCCCVILGDEQLPSPQVSTLILRRTPRSWGARRHRGPDGLTQAQEHIPGVCRGLILTRMGSAWKIWQWAPGRRHVFVSPWCRWWAGTEADYQVHGRVALGSVQGERWVARRVTRFGWSARTC